VAWATEVVLDAARWVEETCRHGHGRGPSSLGGLGRSLAGVPAPPVPRDRLPMPPWLALGGALARRGVRPDTRER